MPQPKEIQTADLERELRTESGGSGRRPETLGVGRTEATDLRTHADREGIAVGFFEVVENVLVIRIAVRIFYSRVDSRKNVEIVELFLYICLLDGRERIAGMERNLLIYLARPRGLQPGRQYVTYVLTIAFF